MSDEEPAGERSYTIAIKTDYIERGRYRVSILFDGEVKSQWEATAETLVGMRERLINSCIRLYLRNGFADEVTANEIPGLTDLSG